MKIPSLSKSQLIYVVSVFLSAFLLFQVQPLISKTILPWFGGTPSVWTTCMLFFQVLLFGGYSYAHLLSERLTPSRQAVVHILLMLGAVALLPITPSGTWKPTGHEEPTLRIVMLLAVSVGFPFFVISSTGPLLQRWFSHTEQGRSPYRLYAISNAGSLLALISYPFVFEPAFTVGNQALIWSACFVGFVVLCSLCAVQLWKSDRTFDAITKRLKQEEPQYGMVPTLGLRLIWFGLAMAASVMLLATTNQVCLDVASVPFLWVLPLTLYLLSFILCFDSDKWYSRQPFILGMVLSMILVVIVTLKGAGGSIVSQAIIYFSGLFFCAMACHGELARQKPNPRYLTSYFLTISAGGAAGGIFVGVISPLIFPLYLELYVGMLACLVFVFAAVSRSRALATTTGRFRPAWKLPALGCVGICAALAFQASDELSHAISVKRNFYGVLRVQKMNRKNPQQEHLRLMHGRIIHGLQFTSNEKQLEPTTYYGRTSGAGLLLQDPKQNQPRRIGVVGLGIGTLATYANPGDTVRFYEINPDVIRLADEHFTFLKKCRGDVEIVTGDARLSMEHESPQNFDVLVLDAFSGDAIPAHLLTKEAFEIYRQHLKPNGVFAVHISNMHFDLQPVMAGLADHFGLSSAVVLSDKNEEAETSRCLWLLMSADAVRLEPMRKSLAASDQKRPRNKQRILWTDERSNLFEILR